MTTKIDLAKAAMVLLEYFDIRHDASRLGGRSTMAAVLSAQLDLSDQDAAKLLNALEQTGTVRWIPQRGAGWMNSRHGLAIELGYWKLERSQG